MCRAVDQRHYRDHACHADDDTQRRTERNLFAHNDSSAIFTAFESIALSSWDSLKVPVAGPESEAQPAVPYAIRRGLLPGGYNCSRRRLMIIRPAPRER